MSIYKADSRHRVKRSILTGVTPTANAGDFTDGTWLNTDIRPGEFFYNVADERLWIGTNSTPLEITTAVSTPITPSIAEVLTVSSNLSSGQTLNYDIGNANSTAGVATLVAGTATVSTSQIVSSDLVFVTRKVVAGTLGELYIGNITDGVSFDIRSASLTETSTISWVIIKTH